MQDEKKDEKDGLQKIDDNQHRRAQQLPWKLGEETEERREAEIAAPTLAMGTNVVEMGRDGKQEQGPK
ncbi:hypothetical protein AK812_SmicGene20175 [Symbiodinium microadriaticum]|uniref:Uncharacterized protein n=1 Tax=Symbiodinium microadriaticum TaxID=2951 RepID=A0A1Q9DQQ8_SYMMI|nr:hypothetical protein AK812_SmicGene20175 [Symbiodinium microadriaticum]